MKAIYITLTCLLLSANMLFAQHASFVSSGTIEFEKSSNMHVLLKKIYGTDDNIFKNMMEQYQKTQPQFKVYKSTLTFADNKTLYTPIVPDGPQTGMSSPMAEQYNTVYTDYSAHTSSTQKNLFNENFIIKDTLRKIVWKITNETRDIAGYPCRRANGLILDSIYVVAFYTEKISVSGGPESFGGLPGMILQVALPHESVSWLATKVNEVQIPAPVFTPAKKLKVMNNKELLQTIKKVMSDRYSNDAQRSFITKAYAL